MYPYQVFNTVNDPTIDLLLLTFLIKRSPLSLLPFAIVGATTASSLFCSQVGGHGPGQPRRPVSGCGVCEGDLVCPEALVPNLNASVASLKQEKISALLSTTFSAA